MFILSGRELNSFSSPVPRPPHRFYRQRQSPNRRNYSERHRAKRNTNFVILFQLLALLVSLISHSAHCVTTPNTFRLIARERSVHEFVFCFRSFRPVAMDVPHIPTSSTSHDCGSLSRVVMVRKTDQRMINHKKPKAVSALQFGAVIYCDLLFRFGNYI